MKFHLLRIPTVKVFIIFGRAAAGLSSAATERLAVLAAWSQLDLTIQSTTVRTKRNIFSPSRQTVDGVFLKSAARSAAEWLACFADGAHDVTQRENVGDCVLRFNQRRNDAKWNAS